MEVNALVESLGQRSFADPDVNCTISFRQTCSDFSPNMGRLHCPFHGASALIPGIGDRTEFQVCVLYVRASMPACA
jgi:hypothetical protein